VGGGKKKRQKPSFVADHKKDVLFSLTEAGVELSEVRHVSDLSLGNLWERVYSEEREKNEK